MLRPWMWTLGLSVCLVTAGWLVVTLVLGQLLPVVILPLFYKVTRLEDPALLERLRRLAGGTGLGVEGVYRLLLAPNPDSLIVNLGNPDEVTVQQLAAEILELTGSQSEITFRPLPEDDPKVRRPDIRRAKEILGWQPVVPRDEGLRKTLPYFKEALAQLHVADRERKRLQLQAMG